MFMNASGPCARAAAMTFALARPASVGAGALRSVVHKAPRQLSTRPCLVGFVSDQAGMHASVGMRVMSTQSDFATDIESILSAATVKPTTPTSSPLDPSTSTNPTNASDPVLSTTNSNTDPPANDPLTPESLLTQLKTLSQTTQLTAMHDLIVSFIQSPSIHTATPHDIKSIFAIFDTLVIDNPDHAHLIPNIYTLLKQTNIPIPPDAYPHIITSIAKTDDKIIAKWQFLTTNLSRDRVYVESLPNISRSTMIKVLETQVSRLESIDIFSDLIHIANEALELEYDLPRHVYESVIHGCSNRGHPDLAEQWATRMMDTGHIPSPTLYTDMILCHGITGNPYQSQTWFERYTHQCTKPTMSPFIAFAKSLASCHRASAVIDLVERVVPASGLHITSTDMNDIIRHVTKHGDHDTIIQLYEEMIKNPGLPKPNIVTHNLALVAYMMMGRLEDAMTIYRDIGAQGINTMQLGILGHFCVKAGKLDHAMTILKSCFGRDGFDASLYGKMVEIVSEDGKYPDRVMELFKEAVTPYVGKMDTNANTTTDTVTESSSNKQSDKQSNTVPDQRNKKPSSPPRFFESILSSTTRHLNTSLPSLIQSIRIAQSINIHIRHDVYRRLFFTYRKSPVDQRSGLTKPDYEIILRGVCAVNMDRDRGGLGRDQLRNIVRDIVKTMRDNGVEVDTVFANNVMGMFVDANDDVGVGEWRDVMRSIGVMHDTVGQQSSDSVSVDQDTKQSQTTKKPMTKYDQFQRIVTDIEHDITTTNFTILHHITAITNLKMVIPIRIMWNLFESAITYGGVPCLITVLRAIVTQITGSTQPDHKRTEYVSKAYNIAMIKALETGNPRLASTVMDEMGDHAPKYMTMQTYDRYFTLYSRMPRLNETDIDTIRTTFDTMVQTIDIKTIPISIWKCMMKTCDHGNHVDMLRDVVKTMIQSGHQLDIGTIPILVHVYARNGLRDDVMGMFDMYLDMPGQLDIRVFNDTMRMYVEVYGDIDTALRVWKVSAQKGVMPNSDTLRWVLEGLCVVKGDMESAEKLFGAMTRSGGGQGDGDTPRVNMIMPNMFHYQALITGYANTKPPYNTDRMIQLYEEMQGVGCPVTVTVYEAIVGCLVANGSVSLAQVYRDRMEQSGVAPTHVVENALMKGYWKNGDVMNSCQVFERMAVRDEMDQGSGGGNTSDDESLRGPTLEAYEMMISGHVAIGQHEKAVEYFERLERSNAFPKQHVEELEKRLLSRPKVMSVVGDSQQQSVSTQL